MFVKFNYNTKNLYKYLHYKFLCISIFLILVYAKALNAHFFENMSAAS